ncbi:sensor domain-containing protein [Alkaliphilus crotonatoxidans]
MEKNDIAYGITFRKLIELFPNALYVIKDDVIIDCNQASLRLLGYDNRAELIGRSPYELSPPLQRDGQPSKIKGDTLLDQVRSGEELQFYWTYRRKNGESFMARVMLHNIKGFLYAVVIDIDEEFKEFETIIEKNQYGYGLVFKQHKRLLELFKKAFNNNSEGVIILNLEGKTEWINNAFQGITGYELEDLKGKVPYLIQSEGQGDTSYQEMWNQLASVGKWSGEIWSKNKSGELRQAWLSMNAIDENLKNNSHFIGILKDLSEKKMIDNKVKNLVQKDILTGLNNRSYFIEKLDELIEKNKAEQVPFAILCIDLNNFKEINDSLGHHMGDLVLKEFAGRLSKLMRSDFILARYSGDEFLILLNGIKEIKEVEEFSKKVISEIKKSFKIEKTILYLSANIGISMYPKDGTDSDSLIRCADIAMFNAKEVKKHSICFYNKTMSKEVEDKFLIANYLNQAIEEGEYSLLYQPIFDLNNHQILGAEALLRWENKDLGMVPPDKFIPIAENTGQIWRIGEWVMETVLAQLKSWLDSGYRLIPIAINISVKQLEQEDFHGVLKDKLMRNKIPVKYLELEITESVSTGNLEVIMNNLAELTRVGFKISMDDFGTGYSSLGHINLFQLDKIKIDKVFIHDLKRSSKQREIIKAIITMAKSLEMKVVAEGIETREQYEILSEIGCDLGQGYFLSKPIKKAVFEQFLKANGKAKGILSSKRLAKGDINCIIKGREVRSD